MRAAGAVNVLAKGALDDWLGNATKLRQRLDKVSITPDDGLFTLKWAIDVVDFVGVGNGLAVAANVRARHVRTDQHLRRLNERPLLRRETETVLTHRKLGHKVEDEVGAVLRNVVDAVERTFRDHVHQRNVRLLVNQCLLVYLKLKRGGISEQRIQGLEELALRYEATEHLLRPELG